MVKNKDLPDDKEEEIAVREVGDHGRITVPAELREEFGGRFLFLRAGDRIVLKPIADGSN